MSKASKVGSVLATILFLAVVALAALAFLYRQEVIDAVRAQQFTPSSEVAALADRAGLSNRGRFLYYVAHPSLESASSFNQNCQRQEDDSPILGCYRNGSIYIYNIDDERLDGIKEVTAAHEMLHVAYERLPDDVRARVGALLEAEYQAQASDTLKKRMEYYQRAQPGQHENELHSIVATEFVDISEELEAYYETYFTDRSTVTQLFAGYNSKFEELKAQAAVLLAELEAIEAEINQQTEAYNRALEVLNRDIAAFNRRAGEPGEFASQAAFNAERSTLLQRADSIEGQRAGIEQRIATYNQKQREYNSLVDESNSLQDSLDSELAPAPQLQGNFQ